MLMQQKGSDERTFSRLSWLWLACAGIFACMSVGFGAAGAHILDQGNAYALSVVEKASRYQMMHALAILGLLAIAPHMRVWVAGSHIAIAAFLFGCVLFSGSLYAIGFLGRDVAFLTPIGGSSFLIGWLCVVATAIRNMLQRLK